MDSAEIKHAQNYLQMYGYLGSETPRTFIAVSALEPPPEAEGELDKPTRRALENFQQRHGLAVTGEPDPPTLERMSRPRCGNPDVRQEVQPFVPWPVKWESTNLTYGFANFSRHLSPDQVRSAIRQALDEWSVYAPLSFTEVPQDAGPNIVIAFVSGHHPPCTQAFVDNVMAHAWTPTDGDAHFNEQHTWSVAEGTITDLVGVALHELGHSLGLDHTDKPSGSVMMPTYTLARRLGPDDIEGIQHLYGRR